MAIDLTSVSRAIAPTREGLKAAGFDIDIDELGGILSFTLLPLSDACAECLVPKPIFLDILGRELAGAQIVVDAIEVHYPADFDETSL